MRSIATCTMFFGGPYAPDLVVMLFCYKLAARRRHESPDYVPLDYGKRLEYSVLYFALIAWSSLMTYKLHESLSRFR